MLCTQVEQVIQFQQEMKGRNKLIEQFPEKEEEAPQTRKKKEEIPQKKEEEKEEKKEEEKKAGWEFIRTLKEVQSKQLNQNSLIWMENHRQGSNYLYVPAYVRCHFRTMKEMDIQNLSCSFSATMNISFYLGKHKKEDKKENNKDKKENNKEDKKENNKEDKKENNQEDPEKVKVKEFASSMHKILLENLKITFQNDFVLNVEEDLSSNVSDSDRLIRAELTDYENEGFVRYYSNIIITRNFKFGLHSDIFFFPLEQNTLDLVTTINQIKIKMGDLGKEDKQEERLFIRFNCMDLEIKQKQIKQNRMPLQEEEIQKKQVKENIQKSVLVQQLEDLYMLQTGKELTSSLLQQNFKREKNHPFFRDIKLSFPLKQNATEFGYYNVIEQDVKIFYTMEKQLKVQKDCYQRFKACIFCSKEVTTFDSDQQKNDQQKIPLLNNSQDRSIEDSYCNAIMKITLLKASLGTIIQLCIPIIFLSFLTLVEFLYSTSTTLDQVRGQKIGSSTLIVATYISFIYLMRTVIPPTPSWSLFQVAVCLLAASCLAPIIECIYIQNVNKTTTPFSGGLFLACFILNTILCFVIIIMLVLIKWYMSGKVKRHRSTKVEMGDLLKSLTREYFHIWRNQACRVSLQKTIQALLKQGWIVKIQT